MALWGSAKTNKSTVYWDPPDLQLFIPDRYIKDTHPGLGKPVTDGLESLVTLGEAIDTLPELPAGDGQFRRQYVTSLRDAHMKRYGKRCLYDVLRADKADSLTTHTARPHSARDLHDFLRLREGENSKQAIARGEQTEFPYDRENFKDRYTKQNRAGQTSAQHKPLFYESISDQKYCSGLPVSGNFSKG